MSRRSTLWTEFGLVLMVTIWGVNFSVVKWALESFDPLGFNALRHLIASVFLFLVLYVRRAVVLPRKSDFGRIAVLGIIGNLIYQMAFIYGLERTRAGNAALMLALIPIFLLALERPGQSRNKPWLGALVSITGVGLVTGTALTLEGVEALFGDLILIGASAVWAIYTIGAHPLIARYGPLRTTAYTLWVGSLGLLLVGAPSLWAQDWREVSLLGWGGVLYSSVLSIGVAYLLWYRGVQRLGGARAAVFSNLTPVVALAVGTFWLGERLTWVSFLGSAMVIGGIVLVRRHGSAGPAPVRVPPVRRADS